MSLIRVVKNLQNQVDIAQRNAEGVAEKTRIWNVMQEVNVLAAEIGIDSPKWSRPENIEQIDCSHCGEPVKRNWETCPDCGTEVK